MARIGGVDIPYDEQLEKDLKRPQPTPLFPSYHPTKPPPLSPFHRGAVSKMIMIRDRLRNGPLHTTLSDQSSKQNPFEGMETYSQQYFAKPRLYPNLRVHWSVKNRRRDHGGGKFFPRELWGVLGLDERGERRGVNGKGAGENGVEAEAVKGMGKEKDTGDSAALLDKGKGKAKERARDRGLDGIPDEEEVEEGEEEKDEDEGVKKKVPDEDEEEVAEDVDDIYETDEEDMGGDYNAEQYFDDGEEEGDDGDDGGGGDYYE
ncbi:MAG: hypothetical protein MMC23_001385 [Stictis urceolatum]|nr:hypothetical protein [Stictis urceolata]